MSDMSVGAVQLCVSAWHRAREYPQKPQRHKKRVHTRVGMAERGMQSAHTVQRVSVVVVKVK